MDWRTMLDQQITSTIKNDFTWMKPSRKGWGIDAILPGLKNDTTIDICVAIDTSGSISNKMLNDFLSEINGIMSQYTDYKIYIWSFDTDVHNPELFTPDKSITDYKPAGFGGTDFDANWTWMKQNAVEPKKLIVFTDGYPFGSWGDENYCDTLWVVHSHHDKNVEAPFGQTCRYESN
jgi:predicted metal-dependent peptidase